MQGRGAMGSSYPPHFVGQDLLNDSQAGEADYGNQLPSIAFRYLNAYTVSQNAQVCLVKTDGTCHTDWCCTYDL